MKISITVLA